MSMLYGIPPIPYTTPGTDSLTAGGGGGGPPLSNANPQPLGVPAPGVSPEASRADHVHQMPALGDLTNVTVPAPSNNDVLTYDLGTTTWIAAAPATTAPTDPYLVINSGPPASGFYGFPGDVLLARQPGVVRQLVVRYLVAPTGDGIGSLVLSPDVTSESNIAIVLNPRGTGGLQAQVADSTTVGGNARGTRAVDWQQERNNANQVASGTESTVGGGRRNRASGVYATVSGGQSNTASGTDATVAGGQSNTASSTYATVAGGGGNAASNTGATVAGGGTNTASGGYATVPGGESGLANQRGMLSHASGQFSAQGDAQYSRMILRRQTTDATPTVLTANGGAGAVDTRVLLPARSAYCFDVYVIATQSAGGSGTASDSAWWHFRGGIRRDNANNTTLIGTNTEESSADAGAAAWVVTVTADDVNEALQVEVTGEVDKTIRWVATVQYSRVAY